MEIHKLHEKIHEKKTFVLKLSLVKEYKKYAKKNDVLRSLSKAQAEIQLWKSKYENEALSRIEELEGNNRHIILNKHRSKYVMSISTSCF